MSYSLLLKEYVKGWALSKVELNPSNFYDAKNIEELHDMVWERIFDELSSDSGDINVSEREVDYELPQEFIDEWKSLKGLK